MDEFIDYFIALGRKGVAINRYKGLGEMNPGALDDDDESGRQDVVAGPGEVTHRGGSMFTTLMGDQVEPRRKFIEDNALEVKNLDI